MNEKFENKKMYFSEVKRRRDEMYKINFFDVQIHCKFIIFPAHRYVLSSRSVFLAEQLASGVSTLNWTEFDDRTGTALLRWIYTNEVVFSHSCTGVTDAEQWLDLLYGSYKLQLESLFRICERKLIYLVNSKPSRRFHDVSKEVGADQLLEKCLELRLNVHAGSSSSENPADKINAANDSSNSLEEEYRDEEFEELLQLNKLTYGYHDFRQFSDIEVTSSFGNVKWQAHAHILESRSKKFLTEFQQTTTEGHRKMRFVQIYGIEHKLLRWLYTDCIEFDDNNYYATTDLLKAARFYMLPTLFERCEQKLSEKVDLTSCAFFHRIAEKHNATTILNCCNQLILKYFNKAKSQDCSEVDVEFEMEFENSQSEMMVNESPNEETVEGLLMLNDDCLLHLFRFVSLVDLGSIKDTCKRLNSLADQTFRLFGDKSLRVTSSSMFADIWILTHFGKFIESLSFYSFYERYELRDKILDTIAWFTNEQLKSISFNEFDERKGENFECLKTVLKNVECIEFSSFKYDSNIESLLNYCENLKEVNIEADSIKLNTDWCWKNPNITKFTMWGFLDDQILEEICKKLTRLECLSVDCIETETNKFIHLSRLSSTLTKLKIQASNISIDKALQHFDDKTVLQELTLSHSQMTESLASVLGDFPNLSTLVFENRADFNEMMQEILSKTLVSIESLTFEECDEITFKVIARIIKNLSYLKKLTVIECNKIKFINIDDYLSLRNTRNLQIFLDCSVYERTCKFIGNRWLDNVQVKLFE